MCARECDTIGDLVAFGKHVLDGDTQVARRLHENIVEAHHLRKLFGCDQLLGDSLVSIVPDFLPKPADYRLTLFSRHMVLSFHPVWDFHDGSAVPRFLAPTIHDIMGINNPIDPSDRQAYGMAGAASARRLML